MLGSQTAVDIKGLATATSAPATQRPCVCGIKNQSI